MRNIFFVILISIVSLSAITNSAYAQENSKPRLIKVTGHSDMSVSPDLGELNLTITQRDMSASQAITKLNSKTKEIFKRLNGLGFKDEDIKTLNFQINENRIYRNGEMKDSGFVAMQTVQVEFENKKERISQILTSFSKTEPDFQFNFNFKLSDAANERVRNELIKKAINNAKDKANLIANTAGVKLAAIHEISYGMSENVIFEPRYAMMDAAMNKSGEEIAGFTPQDIKVTDRVIMMWEIE